MNRLYNPFNSVGGRSVINQNFVRTVECCQEEKKNLIIIKFYLGKAASSESDRLDKFEFLLEPPNMKLGPTVHVWFLNP